MATELTGMRLDRDAVAGAKAVFDALGLSMSDATNAFLKAVVREGGPPFDMPIETNTPQARDFCAEYLAPLMGGRYDINRVNKDLNDLRAILIKRHELINFERRIID